VVVYRTVLRFESLPPQAQSVDDYNKAATNGQPELAAILLLMANARTERQIYSPTLRRPEQQNMDDHVDHSGAWDAGGVGILSRTIVPSTSIRWILPARIRHRDHDDVVFIGESFVQLREFLPTRLLADLPARLELGCRILAAKVISYVDTTPFIDLVVKQEQLQAEDSQSVMPPQILLLALDFCEIAFVYAENVAPMNIRFKVARKKLPADVSCLGQYGRHLAVEPLWVMPQTLIHYAMSNSTPQITYGSRGSSVWPIWSTSTQVGPRNP
jgi:hypothetical protein